MHLDRMKHLVDVLDRVYHTPEMRAAFSLNSWFEWISANRIEQNFEKGLRGDEEAMRIPHNCGTTACAVGYAGLDEGFREEGLLTTPDGNIKYTINKGQDSEETVDSWDAVTVFFEISPFVATVLFSSEAYKEDDDVNVVRKRVIEAIRDHDREYDPDGDYNE